MDLTAYLCVATAFSAKPKGWIDQGGGYSTVKKLRSHETWIPSNLHHALASNASTYIVPRPRRTPKLPTIQIKFGNLRKPQPGTNPHTPKIQNVFKQCREYNF
eukprot:4749543-Amphidinium_carterae.1